MNGSPPRAAAPGRRPFERFSLARQFLLASAVVLLVGVGATGTWVGQQIEDSVVHRTARMASIYFESIVAGRLNELVAGGELSPVTRQLLDDIFIHGPLAQKVVRFKLWTPDGRVHYSSLHEQEAQRYAFHDHHGYAFAGQLVASISALDGPDNARERERWNRLIEIYVPLRAPGSDRVAAVAEFYHSMDGIDVDIHSAQRQSWLAICLGALLLYSGLYALVYRASHTIRGQRSDLQAQLVRLQQLLAENRSIHLRLQQAGAQTASLSELSLRRIAADLHDGPAQDLAFALLMLDEPGAPAGADPSAAPGRLRTSLQRAMCTLRDIAGGLVVPGMAALSLADVVRRAAADSTQKSGVAVAVDADDEVGAAPEAVKITVYRFIQEALANNLRHASGHAPRVAARRDGAHVTVEVADDGPGFSAEHAPPAGHFGLAFLRERAQLLSGTLEIHSAAGQGTTLRVRLPLNEPQTDHA